MYLTHEERAALQPMYAAIKRRDWPAARTAAKASGLGWWGLVYYSLARFMDDHQRNQRGK